MATAAESGNHKPFVHLHLHTKYSLLDGAIRIPDLLRRVSELNQPAVAVTDHGVMFSTVQLFRQAKQFGVKPIIGCELYLLAEGDYREKGTKVKPNHITILARNEKGYRNLSKLVSEAFINGFYYRPRVDMKLLEENSDGLLCLSGCLNGVLSQSLLNGKDDRALEYAQRLRSIFGEENFFIELQNHGLPEQKKILEPLYDLARKTSLPIVATNDCHYLKASDYEAHDALLCIGTGKLVNDENRLRYTSHEYYVKSGDEMAEVFDGKYAEAVDNTLRIAERCNFELETGKHYFPNYEVPESHTIDTYFEEVARKGLQDKMHIIEDRIARSRVKVSVEDYHARLKREIDIIRGMGYSGYFLIVWDFIRFARENSIPVGPGRGSGAGSLVAYAMGITGVDPMQFNLLFERFLNPERVSMPDFDIDFCMRRRSEVINYVTEKYGWKNVAQIITFGTLKARNAIRDVGRVLDVPYSDVDKIAKAVPEELGITLEKALNNSPDLKSAYDADPTVKKIIDIAQRLEGLTRHASTHAAGVVIAPKPLLQFLPLFKSSKDEITTQYDMTDVEDIGLIKMDFLGLRTLTVLQDTVDAIEEDFDKKIDVEHLPDGDSKAYKLLSSGKTCGIFQFESRGMRELLMRYIPERLEDLSALNALYRPGPIKGGLLDDFIERKHGRRKVEYIHPDIEEITRETYGVILYQEQVMQIASAVAGFSLGEADILRRAMGKKKKKLMAEMKQKFMNGASEHGLEKEKAVEIYDYIDKFSGYGFNKSHSTAYGYIAYQTAYLKAHYPAHFMASLMSSEMEDSDRLKIYADECSEIGIEIYPPDINTSQVRFTVENMGVRYAMAAVKNVGVGSVEAIVRERDENGPFTSLFEFCERVDMRSLNKRVIESLIKAGCFDSVSPNRAQLYSSLDRAYEAGQKAMKDRESGQESLFGGLGDMESGNSSSETAKLLDVPEWPEKEKLAFEKECLGFYLSGHPLSQFADELRSINTARIDSIHEERSSVSVGGIITKLRKRQTRSGKMMANFVLEDDSGSIETVVFPKAFTSVQETLIEDAIVVVEGSIRMEADSPRLFADSVTLLSEHKGLEKRIVELQLDLDDFTDARMIDLIEVIKSNKGSALLLIRVKRGTRYDVELTAPRFLISASPMVLTQIVDLAGQENVSIKRQRDEYAIS